MGAVLGQCKGKNLVAICYASKTLNDVQLNYNTIEKELVAIIFASENFRSYLLGSEVIIFSYHAVLKFLLKKN